MSVRNLGEEFSALEDPRCSGKVEHRLIDILVTKVKKRMEQVDASIARYLAALDRADREEGAIGKAKAHRRKEKIAGLRSQIVGVDANRLDRSWIRLGIATRRPIKCRERQPTQKTLIALGSNDNWVRRPEFVGGVERIVRERCRLRRQDLKRTFQVVWRRRGETSPRS